MWKCILAWIIASALLLHFLHCGTVALGGNAGCLCSASVLQTLFSCYNHQAGTCSGDSFECWNTWLFITWLFSDVLQSEFQNHCIGFIMRSKCISQRVSNSKDGNHCDSQVLLTVLTCKKKHISGPILISVPEIWKDRLWCGSISPMNHLLSQLILALSILSEQWQPFKGLSKALRFRFLPLPVILFLFKEQALKEPRLASNALCKWRLLFLLHSPLQC